MTTPWALFAHLLAMVTYALLFVLFSRLWRPLRDRLKFVESEERDDREGDSNNDEEKKTEVNIVKPKKI